MANTKMGFEGQIFHGPAGGEATSPITNSRDISESFGTEKGATTVRGTGLIAPLTTQRVTGRNYSLKWTMLQKSGNAALTALMAASILGDPVAIRTKSDSTGKGVDGDMILSWEHGKPLNGEQTIDFTAEPNDDNREFRFDV